MSFYGNSYQYLAETFAHIILKNMGIDNVSFPQPEINQINISAEQADSGVNIFSGNHWIILNPIYDVENKNIPCGLQIWHNSPITSGTLSSAVPEVLETVEDTIKKEAPLLGFDSCIKLPIITYDPAGHCLAKDEAIYFKMPADPTGEIRKEVNEFKDAFEKGMDDMTKYVDKEVAKVTQVEQDLRKDLVNLNKAIADSTLALKTANDANILSGEAKQKADDAFRVADEAKDLAQEINTQLTYIRGRLDSLENK